jgi:hypothetical protein
VGNYDTGTASTPSLLDAVPQPVRRLVGCITASGGDTHQVKICEQRFNPHG